MYDIAIIGAGSAGIECAKAAKRARLQAALIDEDEDKFGGICINSGCIPTKFFINCAKQNKSWNEIYRMKNKILQEIKIPLKSFLEKQGINLFWGRARFKDKNTLIVADSVVTAKYIVIASGSLAKKPFTHPKIVSAEELFEGQATIPDNILIIGAGYIGLELASLLHRLGKNISVIEQAQSILPTFESGLSSRLKTILERKKIPIQLETPASPALLKEFDMAIAAVGRTPNLEGLNIEAIGLERNEFGWIETNECMNTNIENIYACGDVTGKRLLAYTASYQGRICIDNIMGFRTEERL